MCVQWQKEAWSALACTPVQQNSNGYHAWPLSPCATPVQLEEQEGGDLPCTLTHLLRVATRVVVPWKRWVGIKEMLCKLALLTHFGP